MNKIVIRVHIDRDDKTWLETEADARRCSVSGLVRMLVVDAKNAQERELKREQMREREDMRSDGEDYDERLRAFTESERDQPLQP